MNTKRIINRLTEKQEKFVQELLKGKSQREAYKIAYPASKTWKDTSIDVKACEVLKNEKVKLRYDNLKRKIEEKTSMTREKLINGLEKVFNIAVGEISNDIEIISEEEDEEGNVIQKIKRKKVKSADLKNVASIADRISKLMGYDKHEEVKQEPIQIILKKAECQDCENEDE